MSERDYTEKPFVPTAAPAAPEKPAESAEVAETEQERVAAIRQEDTVLGTGAVGCLEHPELTGAEYEGHDHKEKN